MVEPQSTNLNNGNAVPSGVTEINSSVISPDGLTNANKIISNNTSDKHFYKFISGAGVQGEIYTFSLYVKKAEYTYVQIAIGSDFGNINVNINLVDGTISNNTIGTVEVVELNGGWYRIKSSSLLSTGNDTWTTVSLLDSDSTSRLPIFDGDGVSGVYVWGAQLEQGSVATSYIPINGSTVTRLADNISVPTPAGVTSITETIDGVDQTPITTIPTTYSLPVGNINKVKML